MFKIPTTIVLGAGASYSYGYPVGSTLVDELIKVCAPEDNVDIRIIKGAPLDHPARIRFKLWECLKFYDPISIDSFLWHYQDEKLMVQLAKTLIAEILLNVENSELFIHGANLQQINPSLKDDSPTHWMRFLWDAIVSGLTPSQLAEPGKELNFEIITFNYDNSLEHFLIRCAKANNSMFSLQQQSNFLANVTKRIHHVYGQLNPDILGKYISQRDAISFSGDDFLLSTAAEIAAPNIRLINERSEESFSQLQSLLQNRDQVIFLGFGFDDTNIGSKVLNLKNTLQPKRVNGLSFLPVVKYTNLGDSEKVNRKLAAILDPGSESTLNPQMLVQAKKDRLIKSTKKVYQALNEDFSLNDF